MNITELKFSITLIKSRLLKHSSDKSNKTLVVDALFKEQLWTVINILEKDIEKFELIQSFINLVTADITERVDNLEHENWKRDHQE